MLSILTTRLVKASPINYKIMTIFIIGIVCCIFAGCESSTATSSNMGKLVISSFAESTVAMGESTTATVSLVGSAESNTSITVTIINNNSSIVSESPATCVLLAAAPNNQCTVTLTGISAGNATFSASSSGYATITSESLTITPAGILFGTIQGLVLNNSTILAGSESIATINAYNLTATTRDSSGNLYAATYDGTVWQYTNGGNLWIMLGNSKLDGSQINSLAVDNTGIVYAGTTNGNVLQYSTVHPTWAILATSLGAAVNSVATSDGHIYAGTESHGSNDGQVFEYSNGTWAQLSNFTNGSVLAIATDANKNIYAATGSGQVFEYTNGSWTNLESPITGLNTIGVSTSGLVYAGTSAGEIFNYTGTSWALLGGGSLDGTQINAIALSASGTVYAGTAGPSNAGPGQVFKYESPSWVQLDNLAPSSNNGFVVSLNVNDGGNVYVGIGNASNAANMLQYSNASPYWTVIGNNSLDTTPITSIAIDGMHNFYAGTNNGGVFKFINNNESWTYLGSPDGSQLVTVTSIAVNNDGTAIYAGDFYSNVWIYAGESWTLVGDLASEVTTETFPVVNLVLDNNGHLYAGTNPLASTIGTVWEYESTLESWTQLSGSGTSGSLDNSRITSLATDNNGNLYASTSGNPGGEVFKYTRSNASWGLVGGGSLDGSSVNSITTDNNNIVYAGTNNGNVYTYSEISGFWIQLGTNSSLNSVPIVTLTVDGSNNLYAASSSNTTFGTLWKYNSSTALWDNTGYTSGASFYGLAYLAAGIK